MAESYWVGRSWAEKERFYCAPHPGNVTPYDYQFAGVEYALARDHALIGDEPGLGKSCQSILISNAIGAKRTLVVCPASLRLNWEREVWLWSTLENVYTYPIMKSKDGVNFKADYVILSYDLLRSKGILEALLSRTWDHLILDEAHLLKDPKGNQRTKAICAEDGLRSVVGRITLASGTILPNQPIECYNAFRLLNWDGIDRMSVNAFREHYYGEGGGFIRGPVVENGVRTWKLHWSEHVRNVPRNIEELRRRLREHIMVRRLTKDVLPQLPTAQWHILPLGSSPAVRRALKHEGWGKAQKFCDLDPDAFDGSNIQVDGSISTARRELGEAKAPLIVEYVNELISSGVRKIVVAAYHLSVLTILREGLEKHGLVYMDGATSPARKQKAVDDFQCDESVRIILGQVLPLGQGWNLVSAQDVVNAEPEWVPGNNEQLLRRIRRPGQEGSRLLGHLPLVPNTLEERIVKRAIEKDKVIQEALDVREV
jgi:SWI/SNF-related matrix-associated actin-dependent regulator 1 of chromatin subfamily A